MFVCACVVPYISAFPVRYIALIISCTGLATVLILYANVCDVD